MQFLQEHNFATAEMRVIRGAQVIEGNLGLDCEIQPQCNDMSMAGFHVVDENKKVIALVVTRDGREWGCLAMPKVQKDILDILHISEV